MAARKLVLTYQDYLQMPDDRLRKEIIGGELFVTAAPAPLHQRTVVALTAALFTYVRDHRLGEVLASPIDVVLSQTDVVQPDIVFVSNSNAHIIGDAALHGPPDLVVEVLSPSTGKMDRQRKMDLYARSGVREYWIVDPDTRSVEIYRLGPSGYESPGHLKEDDVLQTDLLPGFALDIKRVWR